MLPAAVHCRPEQGTGGVTVMEDPSMINATGRSVALRPALSHRTGAGWRRRCGAGCATARGWASSARLAGPGLVTSSFAPAVPHGQPPSRPGAGVQLAAGLPRDGQGQLTIGAVDSSSWLAGPLPRPVTVQSRQAAAPPPDHGTGLAAPAPASRRARSAAARPGVSAVAGPMEPLSDAAASGACPATSRLLSRDGRPSELTGREA